MKESSSKSGSEKDALPKNRRIERDIEVWCLGRPAHAVLPAETELARLHGASVMLVRQSLARLEARGVLYKAQGRGTFVSPRARKKLLLLVHHDGDPGAHPHIGILAFALSRAWASLEDGGPVLTLGAKEFAELDLASWPHLFPSLSGVLFFRETAPIARATHAGMVGQVPCLFLGSSFHSEGLAIPARLHDEEKIARLVARSLAARRVAVVGPREGSSQSRVSIDRVGTLLRATGAVAHVDPEGRPWNDVMDEILAIRPRVNGLACVDDPSAAFAVQAALRKGLQIPRDFAIVGVNGDASGRFLDPALTTVRLDLEEDARALVAHLAGGAFDARGSLRLVRGGSA